MPPPVPAHTSRQNAAPGFGRQHAGPHFVTPRGLRPLRSVLRSDDRRLGSRGRSVACPAPIPSPEPLAPCPCLCPLLPVLINEPLDDIGLGQRGNIAQALVFRRGHFP